LVEKNAISRQEYETAVALEQASAAAVEAAKATVQRAQVDLSYTRVQAPSRDWWARRSLRRNAGRARAEHAAHPYLADQSYPHPHQHRRARLPHVPPADRRGEARRTGLAIFSSSSWRMAPCTAPWPAGVRRSHRQPGDGHHPAGGGLPQP
jgi:multidrug efflux pump subunit AcrA (membrane-fusion protein)